MRPREDWSAIVAFFCFAIMFVVLLVAVGIVK